MNNINMSIIKLGLQTAADPIVNLFFQYIQRSSSFQHNLWKNIHFKTLRTYAADPIVNMFFEY